MLIHGVILALALAVAGLAPPAGVAAEIYRWVDEDGNVHFGDKPKDPARADSARSIEVNEAYRPAARSEEELEALRRQHAAELDYNAQRREEAQEQSRQERAEREAQKRELCAKYTAEINKFAGIQLMDGHRVLHVGVDENGQPVSAEKQEAYVAQLRERAAELGCTEPGESD